MPINDELLRGGYVNRSLVGSSGGVRPAVSALVHQALRKLLQLLPQLGRYFLSREEHVLAESDLFVHNG